MAGTCMAGGMHSREHVWQGACVAGACMAGGMHGRGGMHGGHAWQGGMCGRRDGHFSRQCTSIHPT